MVWWGVCAYLFCVRVLTCVYLFSTCFVDYVYRRAKYMGVLLFCRYLGVGGVGVSLLEAEEAFGWACGGALCCVSLLWCCL